MILQKSSTLLTSGLIAVAVAMTTPAMAENTDVRFVKGATSANYQGQLKGDTYDTYTFYAKKGQHLKVTLAGGNFDPMLFHSKLSDSVNLGQYSSALDKSGAYTLPYDGKYTLRVVQPRSQARQGKTPKYWVNIAIR